MKIVKLTEAENKHLGYIISVHVINDDQTAKEWRAEYELSKSIMTKLGWQYE